MVLHCVLEKDSKRSQLSSSSVSLIAKLWASNFTSPIVIYRTTWCRSFIVPPIPYMHVSSRFTFPYSIRLFSALFIFYFYNTGDFPTATFYRQQFLNTLKDTPVSDFSFIFASNFIFAFSHHDSVTHVYSQRIAPGCQEQIVHRT